jgi:deoxyribonuclease-4
MLRIGAHMSVAGRLDLAVDRAVECGFNCLQIFTHSPRIWLGRDISSEEISAFKRKRSRLKLKPVVVHAPYLPNLASPDDQLWQRSIETIIGDLKIADAVKADYYVIHPGSSKGNGVEFGIKRISTALTRIFDKHCPKLTFLLETTAGAGSVIGSSFDELAMIMDAVDGSGQDVTMGICIDTAHLFASGYDLRTSDGVQQLKRDIRQTTGMQALKVIHSNDSHEPAGSRRDHHAHIGKGRIGYKGFRNLMRENVFRSKPWILETPKEPDGSDVQNRKRLQRIYRDACSSNQ